MKSPLQPTKVEIALVLNVPPSKVDEVSQALLDLAAAHGVHDGRLEQGDVQFTQAEV